MALPLSPSKQNRSLIAALVLATGLILSTMAAVFAYRAYDADEFQRFNEASDEIHHDLQERLDFFERCIRQMAATFAINPQITQEQFTNYTFSTGIRANDAGIYSYGVFRREKDATAAHDKYLIWLREITPKLKARITTPVGTDVSQDKDRMDLFSEAIDKAMPVLATRVPSLTPGVNPGQMMAVASYEGALAPATLEERRAKAIGIAYARFSESGLFDQALQNNGPFKSTLQLEVYDGDPEKVVFTNPLFIHTSEEKFSEQLARESISKLSVGGRSFTVRILAPHSLLRSSATLIAFLVIAIGVALSLLTFRLILQREQRSYRAHFLQEISGVLSTSLDTEVISEKLTERLLTLCDWCVIELLNDEGETNTHLYSASTPERRERLKNFYQDYPPSKTQRRMTIEARESKQTQYIERATRESLRKFIPDERRLDRLLEIGFASIVIAPLMNAERVIGTLALYSGDTARLFSPNDVKLINEIADRSSLAFENARLYSESQNLNRAKDHFLAMLSHELRTPMNVILGWLEILTTEDVDEATFQQALDTLNRNAKVQIQLINDLLDVSRIINGKLSLHAVPSRLDTIAAGAIDSVQPAVRAKNIECALMTTGDLTCTIDPERIQQVLWNLLSNAAKFTPNGGKIGVRVAGGTSEIRIDVTDSGQGIEPSFLPFVFDRFRQEDVGFTRSQGGLGLGLSIVRYIVEGHGGTISVASEGRGNGATFTVILPRVAQISEDVAHLAAPAF